MSANDGPLNWSGDDERRADPSSETQDDREVDVTARELKPALERATTTLRTALDEACRTNFERANTGELIRVEEVLAIANEAAKEVISVRQRLRGERRRPSSDSAPASSAGAPWSREVVDADGRQWRVFAVHPSIGRAVIRDEYADGWLSFDAGDETRRLAPIPERWHELPDVDLVALCARADVSPRRRRAGDAPLNLDRLAGGAGSGERGSDA